MGAKRLASAAGAAALVYVALSGRLSSASGDAAAADASEALSRRRRREQEEEEAKKQGEERWPERAPESWREAVPVTARTAGFAYAETLGKWPLGDIAFGISHYMRMQIIGHSMGAGIAAILAYMLREDNKLSSTSCIAFGPAACMTWDLAESSKDFVTTVVNKNDLVPSFGKASAANLRKQVMASSWAPELREQQMRILGFVNSSMKFMRSNIPFLPNPGSKVADVSMLLSDTPVDELNRSADARAAVQYYSALSCWSYVDANRQTLQSLVKPTQGMGIRALIPYARTDQTTEKPTTAGEQASCSPEEPNRPKSNAEKTVLEEKAAYQEHMKHLLKSLRSSPIPSHPHQLYPPGRIMHMVVLPSSEEPSMLGKQHNQDQVVAIYQTPRSMYGKIRLDRSMIRDHYMPRYIETMEMLIEKLADDGDHDTDKFG